MKSDDLPLPKQSLRIFVDISDKQTKLMESITSTVKDINHKTPFIRMSKLKEIEESLFSFQNEAMQLEMMFEKPSKYLDSYKEIEKMGLDASQQAGVEYATLRILKDSQIADRRIQIFTLLEHLERSLSYKKSEIQFNRTILITTLAFIVALASLVVAILT